jgi:hypothetical protein
LLCLPAATRAASKSITTFFQRHMDMSPCGSIAVTRSPKMKLRPNCFELVREALADLRIHNGTMRLSGSIKGHIHTQRHKNGGIFRADHTPTHHGHRFGNALHFQDGIRIEDQFMSNGMPGGWRGEEPVAIMMNSPEISFSPIDDLTRTVCSSFKRPLPMDDGDFLPEHFGSSFPAPFRRPARGT